MQTRRDRLQAYQYQLKRIMSALLGMEPEAPEQPMRRVRAAMFSGVMVGALACGVVALVGWLGHSASRNWEAMEQGLVQLKENGAQFIYMADPNDNNTKKLFPVSNYTSAQLILGNEVITTSKRILPRVDTNKVSRGPQVGINNIPPSLPDAASAADGVWHICNHVETENGKQRRRVDLYAGQTAVQTQFLGDNTLNVEDPSGKVYVIYQGKRLLVEDPDTLRVLRINGSPTVRVLPAWLNAIPEGTPLAPIPIPEAGQTGSPAVSGQPTVIGQVFSIGGQDFFLMERQGLVEITPTQATLLTGLGKAQDPNGGEQGEPTPTTNANIRGLVLDKDNPSPADHPTALPQAQELATSDPLLCLDYSSESPSDPLQLRVGGTLTDAVRVEPAGGIASGTPADSVTLPSGQFSIIRSFSGSDPNRGPLFILTDDGLKYGIPDPSVLGLLGYQKVQIWPVPKAIADMINTGPALDPARAKRQALAGATVEAQPSESPAAGN